MSNKKKILIASDHVGVGFKAEVIRSLPEWQWIDLGPIDTTSVDYPDFAERLTQKMTQGEANEGVLICGSGIGMSIAANKVAGIRAAVVENPIAAKLAKEHNHANVLCLGSRFVAPQYGVEIIHSWLSATPSEEERHLRRIRKLQELDQKIDLPLHTESESIETKTPDQKKKDLP